MGKKLQYVFCLVQIVRGREREGERQTDRQKRERECIKCIQTYVDRQTDRYRDDRLILF